MLDTKHTVVVDSVLVVEVVEIKNSFGLLAKHNEISQLRFISSEPHLSSATSCPAAVEMKIPAKIAAMKTLCFDEYTRRREKEEEISPDNSSIILRGGVISND